MKMPLPVWVLLGFGLWTILILFGTIGIYRWSRILTGRREIHDWHAEETEDSPIYNRAMRAHANCLENLPLYTAIVVAMHYTGVEGPWLDALALTVLVGRVGHSSVHIGFEQTNTVASIRFSLYFLQVVSMIAMGTLIVINA
jgi:uncharacterized MAPEG superfamily protein